MNYHNHRVCTIKTEPLGPIGNLQKRWLWYTEVGPASYVHSAEITEDYGLEILKSAAIIPEDPTMYPHVRDVHSAPLL